MARQYRTDIDGLRAIAILGVVLYHAGLKMMSGGYAGVDVFFVISGYLIGGNILDDLEAHRFTFRNFYTRRARRILPALIVMVLAVMCLGWFTLMPNPYRYMGGAAITSLLSLSNIWFLNRIDYFNPDATQDPLIHTWSLGVEEQFYLIIPLLLLVLWRWRPGLIGPALLGLIIASLAITLITSGEYRMQAFYLLHTRAWELLAGVGVAWVERNRPMARQFHTPFYSLGLGLVLIGLWSVPPAAPWPGVWTLPVVLGTSLILIAPQASTALRALLSNPPMRFIGLISYSLYLWHQPVISLSKATDIWPETWPGIVLALALMIAIATLSWRFVERPFRISGPLPRFRPRALMLAVFATLLIAIGGGVTKGYPSRIPSDVLAVLDMRNSHSESYRRCTYSRAQVPDFDPDTACTFGGPGVPDVLLWGDSHGARLSEPLGTALAKQGHILRQHTLSSCLPLSNLIIRGQTRAQQCPIFNAQVRQYLSAHPEITQVVLFATWKNYMFDVTGPNMKGYWGEDGFYAVPLNHTGPIDRQMREQGFVDALADQLAAIAPGRHVTLVLPIPRPDVDVPLHFATQTWRGTPLPSTSGYPRAIEDTLGTPMRALFKAAIAAADLTPDRLSVIDPIDMYCNNSQCDLIRDGQLLFSDGNHPSLPGLDLFIPAIIDAIVTNR
ncbi:acyltransferase family protein [Shimia sp.]|uniref:acyltransferase family protein n=1 Tax=Shimia sp. TaxID=1954381 RepID=UPI003298F83C